MKRKILKLVLYIVGFFCIIYPIYSKFLSYKNQTESIYDYKKELAMMQEKEVEEKRKKTEEYNNNTSTETVVVDPNTIEETKAESSYNFLQLGEMMGYITIPKINLEVPIYEGINVNNLTKGVAHMENTSLPNGGMNTHSVLAGHTGITEAVIFDNIDKLETGDEFFVTFYDVTNRYVVTDTSVVLPDQTNEIKIEQGKALITLVTCTPKTVNTHRLLVKAEKTLNVVGNNETEDVVAESEVEEIKPEITIEKKSNFELFIEFSKKNIHLFGILIFVIVLLIVFNVIGYIIKKVKERR